jgi:hypothetical protein
MQNVLGCALFDGVVGLDDSGEHERVERPGS